MQIVRCNMCDEWIGPETDILLMGEDDECCPHCGCIGGLMDMDNSDRFSEWELQELWQLFGDIPIDDSDDILEDFLGFGVGTNRFDIWHWFDERYPGGVHTLLEKYS